VDDPILAYEDGRPVRRSEVVARRWAAQEKIVALALRLGDDVDRLVDWPANTDIRFAVEQLEHAYRKQNDVAWVENLTRFLRKLSLLKEDGVLK
jgi:hypothetical protein